MRVHRLPSPLAGVAAVGAAWAATFGLRPRRGLIRPAAVDATAYFSASDVDRARAYQRPRRLLGALQLAVTGTALGVVATRPPGPLREWLRRAAERPHGGAALAGAGMSLGGAVLTLPLSVISERRARAAGLSTQRWGGWTSDAAKASLLGAGLAGGGSAAVVALMRRYPRHWWAPTAVMTAAGSASLTALSPLLLEPIFNKFTPLEEGPLRTDVLALADAAGVDVGDVFRVDASRRTTAANAYVGGLGRTKRVVLFDTLLDAFSEAEVRSVVAHELSHVRHRDVARALAWLAISAPATLLFVERLSEMLADRYGTGLDADARALPFLALAVGIASALTATAGNALSRRVEARADAFALELTDDPAALIGVERKLTTRNLADPKPPRLLVAALATHPPATTRIGYAVAWRERRAAAAS
jgi:STE24 endopeptidase